MAAQDDIDFGELFRALWARRLMMVSVLAFAGLLGVVYLQLATYTYTVQLMVTPTQSTASDSFSSGRLGGLSGLVAAAGLSLPSGATASPFQFYIESLRTREVANVLFEDTDLMAVIFAPEWDAVTGKWRQPPNPLRSIKDGVKRLLGIPTFQWQPPDGARLQDYLGAAVRIEQDPKTPVVSIQMDHKDPAFAATLLAALHEAADDRMRERALIRANDYIEYLSKQLSTVVVGEHRMALASALGEQERLRMMTNTSLPYAAEPFGEPTAPMRPNKPRPFRVLLISGLLGVLAALFGATVLNARRGRLAKALRP